MCMTKNYLPTSFIRKSFFATLVSCTVLVAGCSKDDPGKGTDDPIKIESITVETDVTLVAGETSQLHAKVLPSNAEPVELTWQSNDPSIATVSTEGLVTAISEGQTQVTVTAGEISASCNVTVEAKAVPAESVSLDETALVLKFGVPVTLTATVMPANCTDQVIWSSDNPEVCTVDNQGVVTAVSAGSATVKATAGAFFAECTITIETEVYFAGSLTGNVAVYWHNGTMVELPDAGIAAQANDIFVAPNGDIYIVGNDTTEDGKAKATIWKNGQISYLSDGTKDVQAFSVFVQEEDVYVVGHEVSSKNQVFLWKNGVAQSLPSEYGYAEARSISVAADGTTYVAGYDENPVVWINGVKNILPGGSAASLTAVYLHNNKPYYSGYLTDASYTVRPLVYSDNVMTTLTDGGADEDCYANALYVDDMDNIYVAGNQATGTKKSLWWKNGTLQDFPAGSYKAFDIAGHGEQLIIAGTIGEKSGFQTITKAAYWQDGTMHPLSTDKSDARAVFIRTR